MFRVKALLDATENEKEAVSYSKKGYVVVMERSVYSVVNIFVKILSVNVLETFEVNLLKDLHRTVIDHLKPHENLMVIYMHTPPEICFNRMIARNRSEEIGCATLNYLQQLHDIHEEVVVPQNFKKYFFIIDNNNCNITNVLTKILREKVNLS